MRKGNRGETRATQKKLNRAIRDKDESLVGKFAAMLFPPALKKKMAELVSRGPKVCLREGCERKHSHSNSFCSAEHCYQWRAANPNNGREPELITSRQLSWAKAHRLRGGRLMTPTEILLMFTDYSAIEKRVMAMDWSDPDALATGVLKPA